MSKYKSCPCPICLKCCCHKVHGLNPNNCLNNDDGICNCNDEMNLKCLHCGWNEEKPDGIEPTPECFCWENQGEE